MGKEFGYFNNRNGNQLCSFILETPCGSQYRCTRLHILILISNENAWAEKMDSNVTNTPEQNSGENHSVKIKDKTNNMYITRYGREVKPVQRYGRNQ